MAISTRPNGRVAIVVGAGYSYEAPTAIPLSKSVATDVHRKLISDGVIRDGDCPNPEDLSSVADTVFAVTGSQNQVVERMDPIKFRNAQPNEGYQLAAALLLEQALICLMTLNYDLAMAAALNELGAGNRVAVINGPDDYAQIGLVNVIYLHRNAWSPYSDWILRTVALETDWHGRWEEVIVNRVLASPVTVFAGLGTPARVLLETVKKIRRALPNGTTVYQVDPGARENSTFFSELGIEPDSYLSMGWGQFMRELSDRVLEEHRSELVTKCAERIAAEQLEQEDTNSLCQRLTNIGLVGAGRLRASWLLESIGYLPQITAELSWVADLLLAVGLIERKTATQAVFYEDGVVEFRKVDRTLSALVFAHGRGVKRWLSMEPELEIWGRRYARRNPHPHRVVLAGVQGVRKPLVSPPVDIVPSAGKSSIASGRSIFDLIAVEDLRTDAFNVTKLVDA